MYTYQTLRIGDHEIRHLVIEPAQDEAAPIHCHLEHVSLASDVPYTALSYCWGDGDIKESVHMANTRWPVTKNLEDALRELRRRGYLRVWVDALCINQDDLEERALQITRMASIYRVAARVVAWLADEGMEPASGLLVAKSIKQHDLERFDKPSDPDEQRALLGLICDQYWSRAWILQELAVNQCLQIIWHGQNIDVTLLAKHLSKRYCIDLHVLQDSREHIQQVLNLRESQLQLQPLRLLDALHMSCHARATASWDKVYSIMGLTFDAPAFVPFPTYSKSTEALSRDMTKRYILATKSLDIIVCRNTMGRWFPDWFSGDSWKNPRIVAYLGGAHPYAEDYKPVPAYDQRWRACAESTAVCSFTEEGVLVRGEVFDTVELCCNTLDESLPDSDGTAESPLSLVQHKGFVGPCEILLHREYRRALVWLFNTLNISGKLSTARVTIYIADPFHFTGHSAGSSAVSSSKTSGKPLFVWVKGSERETKALRHWLRSDQTSLDTAPSNQAGPASQKSTYIGQPSISEGTYTRLAYRNPEAGMRLGRTANGSLGWFCKATRPGDSVAILGGCSVPAILRRRKEGGYTIVGDSIIYDMMYGKAHAKKGGQGWQENPSQYEDIMIY